MLMDRNNEMKNCSVRFHPSESHASGQQQTLKLCSNQYFTL